MQCMPCSADGYNSCRLKGIPAGCGIRDVPWTQLSAAAVKAMTTINRGRMRNMDTSWEKIDAGQKKQKTDGPQIPSRGRARQLSGYKTDHDRYTNIGIDTARKYCSIALTDVRTNAWIQASMFASRHGFRPKRSRLSCPVFRLQRDGSDHRS